MNKKFFLRLSFKLLIIFFIIEIILGVVLFSDFFDKILRNALKEKGRDEVIRLLSYKGLIGVFDLLKK